MNMFSIADGGTNGNVITNDDLSNDTPNKITSVSFNGNGVNVPAQGSNTIDGDFGTLELFFDGTYNYTLFNQFINPTVNKALNPEAVDVQGIQESITKDGITVSVDNNGDYDLTWVVTGAGSGIGIDNLNATDSHKAWPKGETFDIDFSSNSVSEVTITIAEIGCNNDYGLHGVDFVVTLADGSEVIGEQQFVPGEINNGIFTFTLDAADYGQPIDSVLLNSTDAGQYIGASFLLNNVTVECIGHPADTNDVFHYTLTDYDGDTSQADLVLSGTAPGFIVGSNVDDVIGETTTYIVGCDEGAIISGGGEDILVGDAGGAFMEQQNQDYNFVFILDTSGSMGYDSKLPLMIDAVKSVMTQFDGYNNGHIVVHIVDYGTNVKQSVTVDFNQSDALVDSFVHLDALTANGLTNYEAPLQSALDWLNNSGETISGALTTTYFISDGAPNRYVDDNGIPVAPPGNNSEEDAIILAEITGSSVTTSHGTFGDNTNEVGDLLSFGEVISVGISIPNNNNLNAIDSDGQAVYIANASELQAVLNGSNPLNTLSSVGGDDIHGGAGADIIFGDTLFTDILANAEGLGTSSGAGWEVFDRLENGEGNNSSWDRDDTLSYIRNNIIELSQESKNGNGDSRLGGDDLLNGGDGNDIIIAQEGDDIIIGGAGSDILYGGTGDDVFLFEDINEGVDLVKDFEAGDLLDISGLLNSYDAVQDSINDFVFATESGGNTTISVDANGSGNAGHATNLVVLEGVTGLAIDQITNNGEVIV